MRGWLALLLVCSTAARAQAPDTLLRAMHDELERSMHGLRLPASPAPYWMAYRVRANDVWRLNASFGALTQDDHAELRVASAEIRVGSYRLDSGSGEFGGSFPVTLDDNYLALRRQFWYLSDQGYKRAVALYAHKETAARQRQTPSKTADFSAAPAVTDVEPVPTDPLKADRWRVLLRRLSGRFRHCPGVRSSDVSLSLTQTVNYLVTSEGTTVRTPVKATRLTIQAQARARDGKPLDLAFSVTVHRPDELPDEAALNQQIDTLVNRLTRLGQSPTQGRYLGPVLLTGPAAPQFLAEVLGSRLSGEPGMMAEESDLGDRLQHRILPTFMETTDDPTLSQWHGQPLFGTYTVDAQGVRGERVSLVHEGRLKSLLMGRRPGPELHRSNGHARTAASVGFSNLLFTGDRGQSLPALKLQLRDECRKQGLPYGLMVVELEEGEPLLNSMLASHGFLPMTNSPPVVIYRVDTSTGREQLVRTGPLDEISLRTLRDIMAVGNDAFLSNYIGNAALGVPPSTVAAPSLLLEELEFKPYSPGTPAPAVLHNPYFK